MPNASYIKTNAARRILKSSAAKRSRTMIHIAIVDDHAIVRRGLR